MAAKTRAPRQSKDRQAVGAIRRGSKQKQSDPTRDRNKRKPTRIPQNPKKKDVKSVHRAKSGKSATIRVGTATADVLEGKDNPAHWTDDELLAGFRRGQKTPAVIPMDVYEELRKRIITRIRHRFLKELNMTVDKLMKIIEVIDPGDVSPAQMMAIRMVMETTLGKPEEHVDVKVTVPAWEKAMARGIVSTVEQIPQLPEGQQEVVEGELVAETG